MVNMQWSPAGVKGQGKQGQGHEEGGQGGADHYIMQGTLQEARGCSPSQPQALTSVEPAASQVDSNVSAIIEERVATPAAIGARSSAPAGVAARDLGICSSRGVRVEHSNGVRHEDRRGGQCICLLAWEGCAGGCPWTAAFEAQ
jgi:hypothetical protein